MAYAYSSYTGTGLVLQNQSSSLEAEEQPLERKKRGGREGGAVSGRSIMPGRQRGCEHQGNKGEEEREGRRERAEMCSRGMRGAQQKERNQHGADQPSAQEGSVIYGTIWNNSLFQHDNKSKSLS